jgi:hypothetical protein
MGRYAAAKNALNMTVTDVLGLGDNFYSCGINCSRTSCDGHRADSGPQRTAAVYACLQPTWFDWRPAAHLSAVRRDNLRAAVRTVFAVVVLDPHDTGLRHDDESLVLVDREGVSKGG